MHLKPRKRHTRQHHVYSDLSKSSSVKKCKDKNQLLEVWRVWNCKVVNSVQTRVVVVHRV